MENIMSFLYNGCGRGDGSGSSCGNGRGCNDGYNDGYGYGSGCGNGDGFGFGYGYGSGNGSGIVDGFGFGCGIADGDGNGKGGGKGVTEYAGKKVYTIDDIPTIIESVKGDIAKGYVLIENVYPVPCYIAKCGGFFAHGDTAKQAMLDARAKYEQNKPLEDRLAETVKTYPSLDTVVPNAELFVLHNTLTGSCTFGRDEFCRRHGIDKEHGSMTMREFITLTKSDYNGKIIQQLEALYKQ